MVTSKCWVIVNVRGQILEFTARDRRRDSIHAFIKITTRTWAEWYRMGMRCVKAEIRAL